MRDVIFGELYFKYGWKRKDTIKIFGEEREVNLIVSGSEGKEILDSQREAYVNFKNRVNVKEIEIAIYKYYLSICEEYRDMLEEDADEFAPLIDSISEMAKLVNPIEMVLLRLENIREIGILFECSWDIDAGLAVRIENEKIIEVGIQNIAL
ncbi:hypothetical protein E4665_03360 [Sporolactobacillus shoreae]|uniref:DUF6985 domain-containing protein n=1 Tax=Sporolactobacillus shoreae TaxID=1465501 RepID=A0A4Z0GRM8_9BACL|nr:hypothetical protein [Sporolactobacillus shoreae]TGB00001.1 hypothetical protein E4665_03360 [Sporolactobacillus shoreae]